MRRGHAERQSTAHRRKDVLEAMHQELFQRLPIRVPPAVVELHQRRFRWRA